MLIKTTVVVEEKLSANKEKIFQNYIKNIENWVKNLQLPEVKDFLILLKEHIRNILLSERKIDEEIIEKKSNILSILKSSMDINLKQLLSLQENFPTLFNCNSIILPIKEITLVTQRLWRELTNEEVKIILSNNITSDIILFYEKPIKFFSQEEIWCDDLKMLFDGYFYRIDNKERPTPFCEIKIKSNKPSILEWFDTSSKIFQLIRRLNSYKNPLEMLLFKNRHWIDFSPEYQRWLVWGDKDKEKLIDSIMKGVHIWNFILYRRTWNEFWPLNKEQYEVIDWKQRLTTLIDFTTGKFTYRWKYYYEFDNDEEYLFEKYMVNITEVEWPLTLAERIELFLAVNDTGKPVSNEVLDNARTILKNL